MKLKKFITSTVVCALAVISLSGMSVSAAEAPTNEKALPRLPLPAGTHLQPHSRFTAMPSKNPCYPPLPVLLMVGTTVPLPSYCMVMHKKNLLLCIALSLSQSTPHVTRSGESFIQTRGCLRLTEVDTVVNQSPNIKISESEVITNSINQLVVVQYGKKNGCSASQEEIDQQLNEYENSYPTIYDSALDLFGEDGLRKGIEYRIIMKRQRNMFLICFGVNTLLLMNRV